MQRPLPVGDEVDEDGESSAQSDDDPPEVNQAGETGDDEAGAKGDTGEGSVNAADLSGLRE